MSSISQKRHDVNGQWQAGLCELVYIHRTPEAAEPIATPLADMMAVQNGDVATGTPWDGVQLSDIFTELVRDGEDRDIAATIVDDITRDRVRALRNGRDKLDTVQVQVETEEPATFELEPSYFEEEIPT